MIRIDQKARRRRARRGGVFPTASGARRRPWATVSWWYSLLFVLPVTLIAGQLLLRQFAAAPRHLAIVVTDAYSGAPLPGVAVAAGDQTGTTDQGGQVRLRRPAADVSVRASAAGYAAASASLPEPGERLTVSLRPATLRGQITDAASGTPIPGARVAAVGPDGTPAATATTDAAGEYALGAVPAGASLQVQADEYGSVEQAINRRTGIDLTLRRAVASGRVTDAAGQAIQGALVRSGARFTATGGDGVYTLSGVTPGDALVISAPGYHDARATVSAAETVDARLERVEIKAIYASMAAIGQPAEMARLIDLVDRTELNAIVIDIKQDTVYYDSQVPFFRNAGTVRPIFDVPALLQKLKDHDIYAIARMVVFQDPLVAEARPDLAVRDETTGDLWRNMNGVGWVNAFDQELWEANVALATEAARLGFDEIQYDYVRFPSDGDLTTADFGQEYTAANRQAAIEGFVRLSHERLRPTGAKLAVDIFGYTALTDDDQGIGQHFATIVPLVDYVCLMLYPSHFVLGNIKSAPGDPNDYPYETIAESLQSAEAQVPSAVLQLRPWLQGFSLPGMTAYGAAEIRAQIDAAEQAGTSGWMIWDPTSRFAEADAFAAA